MDGKLVIAWVRTIGRVKRRDEPAFAVKPEVTVAVRVLVRGCRG